MFTNMKIAVRLYILVALSVVILVSSLVFGLFHSHDQIAGERKKALAMMDDTVLAILDRYYKLEVAGQMTREQAQQGALAVIGALRYDNGTGYFWVNDMQPKMIMHPINPKLDGQFLRDLKDPQGNVLFDVFVKIVRENGAGYHEYEWPKPGAPDPVLKYSHVAGFAPWQWVIGTGVYADDLAAIFFKDMLFYAGLCFLGFVVTGGVAYAIVRSVTQPVNRLKTAMGDISAERTDTEVSDVNRGDEIGEMARALLQLKDSVNERVQLRQRQAEQQQRIDAERSSGEAVLRAAAERQSAAITALGVALERLANGDLTTQVARLDEEFSKLGDDFNRSVSALREVVSGISETGAVVRESAGDISEATGNLSRRTEQQAAALEETAAALDQVTAAVRMASDRALEARELVRETRNSADRSGQIVRNAVDAMGRIEDSSSRIGQIIGVIDEIAFQTNLLALNAGVEAARAGEAGKGFAVVAQEVRELAQRSANAAKEIKSLISQSAHEVASGVTLVRSTGDALREIEALVDRVNEHAESIATASREQATGLGEINSSINQMDQMTQQNAAMVEETTAASQTLARESEHLGALLSRFRLDGGSARREGSSRAA